MITSVVTRVRGHARCVGLLLALVIAIVATHPQLAPARGLQLGFVDHHITFARDPFLRASWLDRIASLNADRLRISVSWSDIATRQPPSSAQAGDPQWEGYTWTELDAAVRDAVARGLAPILSIGNAPGWVDGPGRPAHAAPGTWRPAPSALAMFSRAIALRYSGRVAGLPAVRYWQIWNEPNLSRFLNPQWARGRPAAPVHYRAMLNAAYTQIKSVSAENVVIAAGTAPFGDPGQGRRMRPARFVRELLCLRGQALKRASCRAPARFDVLAHHPYSVGSPCRRALHVDDVSVPDLGKLSRILRRAERVRRALGARRHRIWVTEVSWDSRPPDPLGVPAARHAQWLAEMLFIVARRGADTVTWYLARDEAPVPSYSDTYQSGVFREDGRPKPAAAAFAFPFVVSRTCAGPLRLWLRVPTTAPVTVQRRTRGSWQTVARFASGRAGRVLTRRIGFPRGARLVARSGAATSLVWAVR